MQMDILPTSEGTPVIFHDTSLLRACGVDTDIRQVTKLTSMPWRPLSANLVCTPWAT